MLDKQCWSDQHKVIDDWKVNKNVKSSLNIGMWNVQGLKSKEDNK